MISEGLFILMTNEEIIQVLNHCNFYELTYDTCQEQVINKILDLSIPIYCDRGATKVVIFFPNTDVVVKIPFWGYLDLDNNYQNFLYADDGEDGCDYCKAEEKIYDSAVNWDERFARVLIKNTLLCHIQNHPIYTQPICEPFDKKYANVTNVRNMKEKDKEKIEKTLKLCNEWNFCCFNIVWLKDVLQLFGKDFLYSLLDFLEEENINDLHRGNVGYYENTPVIIDYGGYYDSY